jgi:hypothetical protein
VGAGQRTDFTAGPPVVNLTPEAILSLIATAGVGIAFLLMLQEAIALRRGQDPMTNGVRAFIRGFPRGTYMLAVLIGMVLGHLLWP